MRQNHRNWMPTVFDDLFYNDFMPRANATAPAINVVENDDQYIVELAAPGLKKEDFIPEVKDVLGVASFLQISEGGQTLFI